MESISNYFPGIVKKISDSVYNPRKDHDVIKFLRFEKILFKENSSNLCILIGYERGLEIWEVYSDPVLIFSKRNQGVSHISYIPNSESVNIVLSSLYDTEDFPSNSFQVLSIIENKTICSIFTSDTVCGLECNKMIIAAALKTKVEIYGNKNFNKLYSISIGSHEVKISLANWYIAYTVGFKQEIIDENDINITDVISKTMHNIAESSLFTIKNYIDSSNTNSVYGKIWIKNDYE